MRDDLSPIGQGVLTVAGWVFCMTGALAQCLGLFGTFLAGMAAAFSVSSVECVKAAAGLFVLHAFGSLMLEFGFIMWRSRLPVTADRLVAWWLCRLLWTWMAAIFIPAAVATLLAVWKLEWTALPAATITATCYSGIRVLFGKSKTA